jgi:hypothetical protein
MQITNLKITLLPELLATLCRHARQAEQVSENDEKDRTWRRLEGCPSQIRRRYFAQVLEAVFIAPTDPLTP